MSVGSITSQLTFSTGSSVKGSSRALTGSGINSMSEASIPFQPAIDEPSNAWPFSNLSMVKYLAGTVTCCSLPRVSVKRRSTNFTSFSLISLMTSVAVIAMLFSYRMFGRAIPERNKALASVRKACHESRRR